MRRLRVLVVGAGSIGARHIRNLLALGVEVMVYRYRRHLLDEWSHEDGVTACSSLEEALDGRPDAVVVCNRTDQHMAIAVEAARRGCHLYIEKPLSHTLDRVDELARLVREQSLVVEVGCMLRFHPNLIALKALLAEGAVGTPYYARAFMGQYLPEWRPSQDYRDSYSAKQEQGGGVVFDLIHEIDYLTWLFGAVSEVSAFVAHLSDLQTDTEDVAEILLRFESGVLAQLHLDCLRPVAGRGCEIVGSGGLVSWDYIAGTVGHQRRGAAEPHVSRVPDGFERNAMFVDAMRHFVDRVRDGGDAAVSLEDGVNDLVIALAIHESARQGRAVACQATGVYAR